MSGLKAKYQGTDFKEWYKANYNGADYSPDKGLTRAEGMSDIDWKIGESLYDSYKTDAQREQNYESNKSNVQTRADGTLKKLETYLNNSKKTLEENKKRSQQNASITLDRLKKYLPEQIKAQGLGGLGVSESSMLNAYNSYLNSRGDISNEYQKNKTDLETNYNDNVSNVNLERDQDLSALERAYSEEKLNAWQTAKNNVSDIYNQYEQEYKAAQERGQETAKETVRNAIDNMFADPNNFEEDGNTISYNGYRKIKGIIDSNRELFGEDEYNALITALKSYSLSADIIKADEGTLTYSDVAKYHSGIRTASEFNRAGNEDKTKYGTYQNYLKAMYEKYAANGSSSTGTTTATNTASASTSNANSSTSSSVSATKKEGASSGKKVSAKAFRDDYNLKKKYGTYQNYLDGKAIN